MKYFLLAGDNLCIPRKLDLHIVLVNHLQKPKKEYKNSTYDICIQHIMKENLLLLKDL